VRIAAGSATELESLFMLAQRLNLLPIGAGTELLGKSRRVQKRLYRLNQFLGRRLSSKTHDP